MPHRNFSKFDKNLIEFLSYHHSSWTNHINKKGCGIIINYEDMRDAFDNTLNKILMELNLANKRSKLEKPFTQNQAKILKYIIRAAKKLKLLWILEKLNFIKKVNKSSSVPPNKKLKLNLNIEEKLYIEKIYQKEFIEE